MDDGYEMNGRTKAERETKEVALFLGENDKKLRAGGGELYDVETEFRKTRKNRSYIVPLALASMVLLVALLSWGLTTLINRRAKTVDVDIRSFEDLNLRDLLDSAKRYDDDLDRTARELAALEGDRQARLDSIDERRRSDLALLEAMGLGEDAAASRRRVIENAAAGESRNVRALLDPAIQEKRMEIAAIQEKIAAYDSRSIEEAKRRQEILDNQQQLYEMERKRLTDFYEERIAALDASLQQEKAQGRRALESAISELTAKHRREQEELTARYNPTWLEDDPVRGALSSAQAFAGGTAQTLPVRDLPAGSPVSADRLRTFAEAHDALRLMLNRLSQVPYLNSVPPTLSAADAAGATLGQEYLLLLSASSRTIVSRNNRIGELERSLADARLRLDAAAAALTAYVRNINAAGIVVESRSPADIALFIDPQYAQDATTGRSAWIFRGDDEPVAEIRLERRGDIVFCRVVALEDGMSIRPFDKVLLNLTNRLEVRP